MNDDVAERLVSANQLVNKFIIRNEIVINDYYWELFANEISNLHKIKWLGFELGEVSKEFHAGALGVNKKKNRIFYNSTMNKGRINFTICHELSHFIWDSNYGKNVSYFGSSLLMPYSDDEIEIEKITDSAAGVLMLPDILIVKFLESNMSFPKFSEKLGMSQAALYVRLVQFLEHRLGMRNKFARSNINNLRYHGKRDAINRALVGAYSTTNVKNEIIYAYENCG
ncbi:ImmA/IrrE family metallo-endopeptidase [Vagococcus salmoninarum]|uniref:ImmA/IrrE family metallo-endopeptidase n=1 Tax=Vagococcus salmoninarum TaxID=2739 RepID=UPI00398B6E92